MDFDYTPLYDSILAEIVERDQRQTEQGHFIIQHVFSYGVLTSSLFWWSVIGYFCVLLLVIDIILYPNDPGFAGLILFTVILFFSLCVSNLVGLRAKFRLKTERIERVIDVLETLRKCNHEAGPRKKGYEKNDEIKEQYRLYDSQIPSVTYAYRLLNQSKANLNEAPDSGNQRKKKIETDSESAIFRWQQVPNALLVTNDIVALSDGASAPAAVEYVQGASGPDDDRLYFQRGEKITIPGRFLITQRQSTVIHDNGKKKLHLFKVLEPPAVEIIRNFLDKEPNETSSILSPARKLVESYLIKIFCIMVLISFVCNSIRYAIRPDGFTAYNLLATRQVYVMVLMLPISAPLLESILKLYITAMLLDTHTRLQGKTFEETERTRPKIKCRTFFSAMDLFQHWRPPQSLFQGRVTVKQLIKQTRKEIESRAEEYPSLFYNANRVLGLPLQSSHLVERLGDMTVLCCLDESVVLSPMPSVEEIFLLKGEGPSVVLDLCLDTVQNEKDPLLRFEDPNWKTHLSCLKPMALTAMLSTCLHIPITPIGKKSQSFIGRSVDSSAVESGLVQRDSDRNGKKVLQFNRMKSELGILLNKCAVPDHFRALSKAVGFRRGDLDKFQACFLVSIRDSSIKSQSFPRTVLNWSYHRGVASVYSMVVEDFSSKRHPRKLKKNKKALVSEGLGEQVENDDLAGKKKRHLHLLSWGHPQLLSRFCSEYWDGESIWPLRNKDRDSIMLIDSNWTNEDFDSVAFAYTPIPHGASHLFPSPGVHGSHLPAPLNVRLNTYPYGNTNKQSQNNTTEGQAPQEEGNKASDIDAQRVQSERTDRQEKGKEARLDGASAKSKIKDKNASFANARNRFLKDLVTNSQIFTGLVGSQETARISLVGLIEDLDDAGVRFVHFSPRAPPRARVIADKMGLETDWNTAISLQPLRVSETKDQHPNEKANVGGDLEYEHEQIERSDWDVKAKLPHGIDEIRKHLVEVDDVPLRVPTFTDSTPVSSRQMIEIMQEYGDRVAVVGCSMETENMFTFLQADLAIAMHPDLLRSCCDDFNNYMQSEGGDTSSIRLSSFCKGRDEHTHHTHSRSRAIVRPKFNRTNRLSMQLELAACFNSLACSLVLGNDTDSTTDGSISVLIDIIRESRRLLMNYKQAIWFALSSHLTLVFAAVFSAFLTLPDIFFSAHLMWFLWIIIPLLTIPMVHTLPQRNLMRLIPSKIDEENKKQFQKAGTRAFLYMFVRCFLNALLILVVSIIAIEENSNMSLEIFLWSPSINENNIASLRYSDAVVATQAVTFLSITWVFAWAGLCCLYRNLSLFKQKPKNFVWMICAILAILLQIAYGEIMVQVSTVSDSYIGFKWLTTSGFRTWIPILVSPLAIIVLSEITKHYDSLNQMKSMRRLRLMFDTKLGMWSPK